METNRTKRMILLGDKNNKLSKTNSKHECTVYLSVIKWIIVNFWQKKRAKLQLYQR